MPDSNESAQSATAPDRIQMDRLHRDRTQASHLHRDRIQADHLQRDNGLAAEYYCFFSPSYCRGEV